MFWSKPTKKEKIEYPAFGSTGVCKACGSMNFKRIYKERYADIDHGEVWPDHIRACCRNCGWEAREQLKGNH